MDTKKIRIVGIIGGIGSGKSTVANEFEKLGCLVINADKIAQEYLDSPSVLNEVKLFLGSAAVNPDGKANRKFIAEKVFSDFEKLSMLNSLIHPFVMARVSNLIDLHKNQESVKAIILDIPLLLEVGWEKKCDFLIFVDCSREKRLARIEKKGIITTNQLDLRESFQISPGEKAKKSHYVINNNSDLSDLRQQVKKVFFDFVI